MKIQLGPFSDKSTNSAPIPSNPIKRLLGGLRHRRSPSAAPTASQRPNLSQGGQAATAFEVANRYSKTALNRIGTGSSRRQEGQDLRRLQSGLREIEASIAKENGKSHPDTERLAGLKTLWAEDNDRMLGKMRNILDREAQGEGVKAAIDTPASVRTLQEFNQATGTKAIDVEAVAELKKVSMLRQDVELEIISTTDPAKLSSLKELEQDISQSILDLTRRAFGG